MHGGENALQSTWRSRVLTKNGGLLTNDGSLESIMINNALCTKHGEKMHCKTYDDMQLHIHSIHYLN